MSTSAEAAKRALRARVRAARVRRTDAERRADAEALARVGVEALGRPRCVTAYLAVPGEPDLALLRAALRDAGVVVLLPVTGPGGVLTWGRDDGLLRPGAALPSGLVLPEPVTVTDLGPGDADVVLLPALAVDRAGHRLGQGGGYYDRALAALPPAAPRLVAVVHDDEVLDAVPVEPHDRPVHAALTPGGWVDLT